MKASIIKKSYHHGNLRQALMDAALLHIKIGGADSLSLRALAREVGVSQAAPYRHFEDKVALLSALASDGFERLAQSMRSLMGDINVNPTHAMVQGAQAYIQFARLNPETYRLMYSMPVAMFDDDELETCHQEAFHLLQETVEAGLRTEVFKAHDKDAIVLTAWSLVHGFAQLVLDGAIDMAEHEIEIAFRSICGVVNEGIVA